MAFFDKLTDMVSNVGDKANDVIETTKLKSKISGEKKAIELELVKVGQMYYEEFKNGTEVPEAVIDIYNRVTAHYEVIAETEKTLELYSNPTIIGN